MTTTRTEAPDLLLPSQVGALFKVDRRTIVRWAKAGKLNPIKTPGGHRRYRADEVHQLLESTREGRTP